MESISLSRTIDAPPDEVRPLIEDAEPFMRAAKFATWSKNGFAIARIELDLRIVDEPDTVLAYEQVDGIFEEMWTGYEIEATEAGTTVTARTDFELDVGLVGGVLDATVIKRQRTRELEAQFDYLERETSA
jgi:hypothetical protein